MLQSTMLETREQFSFITSILFLSQYPNQKNILLLPTHIIEEYLFIYLFIIFEIHFSKVSSSYSGCPTLQK